MKKILLIIIATLSMVFVFASCTTPSDDNKKPPIDDEYEVPSFIDISMLNYNSEYHNAEKPEEKGFILYDAINLNTIKFSSTITKDPDFEIFLDDKLVKSIQKSSQGTVYSSYTFNIAGVYTIKVNAAGAAANGGALTNTFTVKVSAGGYPNRVEFDIFNISNQKVNQVQAGESYRLSARVYSESTLLENDNEKFFAYWNVDTIQNGERDMSVNIPNQKEDTQITYSFKYECQVNGYSQTETKSFTIDVINNYVGIEIDYQSFVIDNAATINVVEEGNFHIFGLVTAIHKFTNGETEEIVVNYTTATNVEGVIVPFIKYNGESEYSRYIRGINYASNISNYINTSGVIYQFDPKKDTAEVYWGICYFEQFQGGSIPKYKQVDGSDVSVNLIKNFPQSVTVTKIQTFEKVGQTYVSVFKNVDEVVDVFFVNEPPSFDHYFTVFVEFPAGTKANDYYFEVENNDDGMLIYNHILKRFYPTATGPSIIKVKSAFGDAETILTVTII